MKQALTVSVVVTLSCVVFGLWQSAIAAEPSLRLVRDGDRFRVIWSPTAPTANTAGDRLAELRRRIRDRVSRTRGSLSDSSGGAERPTGADNSSTATPNPAPLSCDGSRYQAERQLLDLINRARSVPRRCGSESFKEAPPLTWDTRLETAAGGHSVDMATYDFLSHTGSDGLNVAVRAQSAGYQWRAIGENIAVGYNSPDAVLDAWLKSPGHCKNIMSTNYTEIGAASARNGSALYGNCARWWTMVVARPR